MARVRNSGPRGPIRVGLVELPAIKLCDETGRNWTALRIREPLVSKQILLAQLRGSGYDAHLINLKHADTERPYGDVEWHGRTLTKIAIGDELSRYQIDDFDVWGIPVNYMQEREIGCDLIRFLHAHGAKTIVGGSDAMAVPQPYLAAGADLIVSDKSGAVNKAAIDFVIGTSPTDAASR